MVTARMRSTILFASICLLTALAAAAPPTPATAGEHTAQVLDIRWQPSGEATYITAHLSGPVRFRTAATKDVIRVDMWPVAGNADRVMLLDRGVASQVTVRRLAPEVLRVGVSLREPARFKVFTADDRLTVTVFPQQAGAVPLPPSVGYRSLTAPTGAGRARVHVATVDAAGGNLEIKPALGGAAVAAAERTSHTATRVEALAAINGSFYSSAGLPIGLVVIDGRLLSAPLPRRSVFAVDATGRAWIEPVEFSGVVIPEGGGRIPISAVNRPPQAGGVALYTPEFGPLTFTQSLVAVVRANEVIGFSHGRPAIPPDGYALAATAAQQHLLLGLTRGQRVILEMALSPPGIQQAIQGGPRLVRDGRAFVPYAWEGFTAGFSRLRAARSAIGITAADKILFVTVDGPSRQSTGMNLPELAALMQGLGARDAMNLDGGGSATLVVGGRVVSALPRGGERTVSSMIVALRRPTDRTP